MLEWPAVAVPIAVSQAVPQREKKRKNKVSTYEYVTGAPSCLGLGSSPHNVRSVALNVLTAIIKIIPAPVAARTTRATSQVALLAARTNGHLLARGCQGGRARMEALIAGSILLSEEGCHNIGHSTIDCRTLARARAAGHVTMTEHGAYVYANRGPNPQPQQHLSGWRTCVLVF